MNTDFLLKRARQVLEQGNLSYARKLLLDILQSQPHNTEALGLFFDLALRQKQASRSNPLTSVKAGLSGLISGMMSLAGRGSSAVYLALLKVEENPQSAEPYKGLGDVLRRGGYSLAAILAYEKARELKKKDTTTLRALARLYTQIKEVGRAYARYQELGTLIPSDREVKEQLKNLAALGAIQGRWDEGDSYRSKVKDLEKVENLQVKEKIIRSSDDVERAIRQTLAEIKEEPNKVALYLRLGNLYRQRGDNEKALETYRKGLSLDDKNFDLLCKVGDITLEPLRKEVQDLTKKVEERPSDEALKKALAEKRQQYLTATIQEYRRRVAVHPTDPLLHYELARYLYEAGQYKEAIAHLQKCIADVRVKQKGLNLLGLCFAGQGMREYAVEQFEKALENVTVVGEAAKEILYNLGKTCEEMGRWKQAEEAYKRIYEVDIGYRDIDDRMKRAYQKAREKSTSSS